MITIDRDYLLTTLADLVRINSINPDLVPGAPGEAAVAAYVADNLKRLGLRVEIVEAAPGRPSVIATLKGKGSGKSIMLNGHIDIVGVDGMSDPFSPSIRDGKLFGRGAYDMKGSVAACMAAIKALVDANVTLRGDVVLAAVADEEYASIGTAEVIKHVKADSAIVTEPTEMEICLAHKGFIWLEVETIGRAAHGSRFDEGFDANMRMGRFLAELDKLEQELRARKPHPLVGPPSLHAAILRGGAELSMYAANCKLQIERRTIPGETEAQVIAELQAIIDKLSAADPSFKASINTLLVRDSMEVSADAPIVKALTHAATDLLVKQPPYVGRPFWMDAALLAAAGIPTVVMGPVGAGAHAKEEWVDLGSVEETAHILANTAMAYCQ
ncbi:MAG TPA: ArgE/DapE family deacylase [Anaerolineales bacterium]|nr:ArgE/DapE family deacylase [Anaerolineales bacterium]